MAVKQTDTASKEMLCRWFAERGIEIHWYKDVYSRLDGWFIWRNVRYEIEVKRRRFASSRYSTTLINQDKFKEIVSNKAILFVIFDDEIAVCKNVADAYIGVKNVYAKHCTDFDSDYEWSEKVELDLNKFTHYAI